jgi:hypothetical protein
MTPPLVPTPPEAGTWGRWYWPIWMVATFLFFIGPEVFALITNWKNTLSNWVWVALRVKTGQSITDWTAAHFLVGGMLIVVFGWLVGHFLFHLWAS